MTVSVKGYWRRRVFWTLTLLALPVLIALCVESWRQMQISSSQADLNDALEHAQSSVLGGKTPAQFTQGRVKGTNGYERLRKVAEAIEIAGPIGPGTFGAAGDSEQFTPKGVSQVLGAHEWPGLKSHPPNPEKTRLFLAATESWSHELEEISRCDVIAQVIQNGDTYGDLLGGASLSWGEVHFRISWLLLARANAHAMVENGELAVRQLVSMARLYMLMRVPLYELQLTTRASGLCATLRTAVHWIADGVVSGRSVEELSSFDMNCERLFPLAAEGGLACKVLCAQWVWEWPSEVWFGWARPDIVDSPFDKHDRQNKFTRGFRYREGWTAGLYSYAVQVLELRGKAPPFTIHTTDQQGLVMSANLQSANMRIHELQVELDTARAELTRLQDK